MKRLIPAVLAVLGCLSAPAALAQSSPNFVNLSPPAPGALQAQDLINLAQSKLDLAGTSRLGTTARDMRDRLMDHINVLDYGAKCDGSTDDTAAFLNASAIATGNLPSGASVTQTLLFYIQQLANFVGIGPHPNGAYEIDVPAGECVLSKPWAVNYGTNTSIRFHGDGSSRTELKFLAGINGLYVTFAPNTNGNEAARSAAWQGQGIEVDGIHFIAATGGAQKGTAISVIGIPLINASNPPLESYHDLEFTNDNGYSDNQQNWAGAFYLQDPNNVLMQRVMAWDHALQTNTTTTWIWLHSTDSAAATNRGGNGNISLDDVTVAGGKIGLLIDGYGFQGINVSHFFTVDMQVGLQWLSGQNTLSGSLTLDDSSMGATQEMVNLYGISTVFSHHNFFYNTAPPQGTNPVFFSASGGTTVESDHDTFYGPLAGWEGTGHSATAIFYGGYGSADVDPSMFSNDIITHFDNGVVAGGGPVMFDDIEVASDTGVVPTGGPGFTGPTAQAAGTVTGVCFRDSGVTSDPTQHPIFTNIHCGRDTYSHDGMDQGNVYEENTFPRFAGGLNLGAPGVTSPASAPGTASTINFHSFPSVDGTWNGLNGFDAQIAPRSGTAGQNGAGNLIITDAFTQFSSPVLTPLLRYVGFVPPATSTSPGNTGDSGVASVGGITYFYYCAVGGTTTGQWWRVALTDTGF